MNTMPIAKAAILRQQVANLLIAIFALLGVTDQIDVGQTVEAISVGATALIALLTIVTRLFKPAPNLTETAVKKEENLKKEGKIP